MRRVGVFGGTFDPPHLGHLVIAEWARARLGLERVLFVPSGVPPHKRGRRVTAPEHRIAMARLAVRGNPAFGVSTLESRRDGPSYTVDTLRALRARRPGERLYLLLGEDSLEELPTWREPEAIRGLATLVVAARPPGVTAGAPRGGPGAGAALSAPGLSGHGVRWLDNPAIALSSSRVRRLARARHTLRYLVPEAVRAYIERHRLYRRTR